MSLVETQTSIEYMYDKRRVSGMVERDIDETPEIVSKIDSCLEALESVYLMGPHFNQKNQYLSEITRDSLRSIIYRVLTVVMPSINIITMSSLVGQSAGVIHSVGKKDSFKITSSVIAYMYYFGLVKIIRPGDSKSEMLEVVSVYICEPEIIAFIIQSMYLPPMVCMPRKLTHNKSSAYLTRENDSVILKSYNHHEGNVCLDTLNKFNSVALSLDVKMLTTFDEEPKTVIDTHERQKQFDKFRGQSYHVFKLLIQTSNDFHLTHKVDKRGRTYAMGYHCSTQANSFRKSIINLAKQELVYGTF